MIQNSNRALRSGLSVAKWYNVLHNQGKLAVAGGLALLVGASVMPLPSVLQAQTPETSAVRANQVTTADQQEPALAVDPTNPNNVLAAAKDWRTGPKQVWYYHSTDGGRTWADGHVDTNDSALPNASDPVLAFDLNGTAYLSYIGYNQNELTLGGIYVARSGDGGSTWGKPVLVAPHNSDYFEDKEWIAVDRSPNASTQGNIYLSWTRIGQSGKQSDRSEIVVSRSTNGGRTFSAAEVVSLPGQGDTQGSFPAIGPNGELYVLYFSNGSDSVRGLYIATSTDGGQSFKPAVKVAPVVRPPSPLPGGDFRIFVLPELAVDHKSGALYAVWNDYKSGDSDTLSAHSTDAGATWSAPVRVNDDAATPRHDQFFPAVTVGVDSTVHVIWLDRRDDPRNQQYLPYYAASTDGGKTFSANRPLTNSPSDQRIGFEGTLLGDYLGLDTSADGLNVYAAWVDTRGGTQDIYFTQFSAKNGPNPPTGSAAQPAPTPAAVPSPQPLTGFSELAFLHKWERTDRPVLIGKAQRSWVWGPISFAAAMEAYAQGKGGTREVQYFDKARMEINNPAADAGGRFYVTNGLLVVEMLTGRIQTGDNQFDPMLPPAHIAVAGDSASPDTFTYASIAPVASLNGDNRATDRTGQTVTATLNSAGQVGNDPARGTVKIAHYEPVLGHNIPDVFWAFMNQQGLVEVESTGAPTGADTGGDSSAGSGEAADPDFQPAQTVVPVRDEQVLDWVADLGYPLTEPYWTSVRIGSAQKWVLVQAFQRRVLTYVADNPAGSQVEMGNVGRQYYDWRYNGVGRTAR